MVKLLFAVSCFGTSFTIGELMLEHWVPAGLLLAVTMVGLAVMLESAVTLHHARVTAGTPVSEPSVMLSGAMKST